MLNSLLRKALLIQFIVWSLYAHGAHAQDKKAIIASIRKETKAINSDRSLKRIVLNNEEFLDQLTDGGGSLTGYNKASQLKKIVSWIGLSNGNEIMEYYFKDKQLIFVYEQFNSFVYDDKRSLLRHDSTETTFQGRYYFANNKLVDYVTTGHNRFENDENDPEKILLEEAAAYRKRLLRKR